MKKILILAVATVLITSCETKVSDSTKVNSDTTAGANKTDLYAKQERNKQTALASVNAINNHDTLAILKDADSNLVEMGDGSMPPTKGVDSVLKGISIWLNAVPDMHAENIIAAADSNYVFVYGEWSGTWKNDLMGKKATGKSFKLHDVDIFKFNDEGKIIEHRSIQSNMVMANQIGLK